MSTSNNNKTKSSKRPLIITKQSPQNGSPDIIFAVINHTYYSRGPQGCPDTLGTDKKHSVIYAVWYDPV